MERLSSVSSDVVNGGDYRMVGSWPGVRAAINARLEEVSFRTGVMAGAVTLLVLSAAVAAVIATVVPSKGGPVSRAAGAMAAAGFPAAAATPPVAAPTLRAPGRHLPEASSPPSAPAAGSRPAAQASQSSPGPGPQEDPAGGNFGGRAPGRGAASSHWPGQWTGAGPPRYGLPGVFGRAFWRPVLRRGVR
jgi:hypothetical protein